MDIQVLESAAELSALAAKEGAMALESAIAAQGTANLIVATGTSQFETLANLVQAKQVAWDRVTAFHLDEYIGIPMSHPASFRGYLKQRFVDRLPPLRAFHYVNGDLDPDVECLRLSELIESVEIDVAMIGIGENGHIAFNDPPADFETEVPYIVVQLDEACRRQQLGEGWFASLEEVPSQAISMSIRQILRSRSIVCSVPDQRKALAVKNAATGPITPDVPASILQEHANTSLYLDREAASLL